ncbi:MAG: hypothetical protein FWC38_02750 [Proteobacteria bacterium]|nr:hypothetical protein [Pseudomonadota bacterium]MCL2307155.1 hypothetical protein [Pseudomonadota bacterium]
MSVAELDQYIRWLKQRLSFFVSGPGHKFTLKRLEVAEKVREIQRGKEEAGDV